MKYLKVFKGSMNENVGEEVRVGWVVGVLVFKCRWFVVIKEYSCSEELRLEMGIKWPTISWK